MRLLQSGLLGGILLQNLVAYLQTLTADVDFWPGNHLLDLRRGFPAE